MKRYYLLLITLLFLLALCSCGSKEVKSENNNKTATLTKTNQKETDTLNMNDIHKIYGTLVCIEDIYNSEDIENINDDDVAPVGVRLDFKLNQQDTEHTVCASVSLTSSIGIDGNEIWIKGANDDDSFLIGTDAVIEYYGELENVSDDIHYSGIYNPDYDVYYDNKIVYKINYIKSITKATADE